MSNLVFVSGDYSSGTTLLFTLFRRTDDFYCLYEPLHQKLLEYLVYPLRIDEDHHLNTEPYFQEYKGFREIPRLFDPAWGVSRIYLGPDDEAPELERYLRYLVDTSRRRMDRVLLKENRFSFRLGWLKARFPEAKIVHIYRDKEKQWASIVRRGQEHVGREDIGQDSPRFAGFNIALWCEDMKTVYPELEASRSATGFRHADVSVDLHGLVHDFEATCARIGGAIGYEFDVETLERVVVRPDQRAAPAARPSRSVELVDSLGAKYAKARVAIRYLLRGDTRSARAVVAGHPGQTER
jgi:hypothetical protein